MPSWRTVSPTGMPSSASWRTSCFKDKSRRKIHITFCPILPKQIIDLAAKPDWFLALSPTRKVPLLKVGQGDGSDAVLFESMVICEYLEESQANARLYPVDALSRARQQSWVEFGTAALADVWQFLNATDRTTADAKQAAFRDRLQRLEAIVGASPYFSGAAFGMVDAVFAPLFRYFDILDPTVSQPIFESLPRVTAWRAALGTRESVIAAVAGDYAERFGQHLRLHQALLAD
jgi:glutathione S-transferase